ncbi:MAG: ferric reductase-like transmembrane domain-containing protein [Terriglobales bacterium]
MNVVDISKAVGLAALYLLTLNIHLGLLISIRYSPVRYWPHRQFNLFALHNWTGTVALGTAALHPLLLLASSPVHFRWVDILFPLWSPQQPIINTLGAAALYTLTFVVITSYYRVALGRRLWKRLHFAAYAGAGLFFTHALLTDPHLRHAPFDPWDAEKVSVEFCLLLVACSIAARIAYGRRRKRTTL